MYFLHRGGLFQIKDASQSEGPGRELGATYIFFLDWLRSCLHASSASTGGLLARAEQSCGRSAPAFHTTCHSER